MVKYFLFICSIFFLASSVFGQDSLERDLHKSFKRFDLIKLDEITVQEKTKSKQPVIIQTYGRYFEFVLTPHDIRAGNYKALESTEAGDRELPRSEVITFKGKLIDDFASEVRFSITENGVEGLIYTSDNKKFFVTQAEKFSKHARSDEAVVFSEEDLIKTIDLSEDAVHPHNHLEEKTESGFEMLKSYIFRAPKTDETAETESPAALAASLRVLEVATEADYQWVTQAGSAATANNQIISILNMVDGIYQRDLGLAISITYQHAWTTPDPYPTGTMNSTLDSFLAYWNTTYPRSQYPRDTAHLFTGKYSNQGLAYIGVICNAPNYAYGLSGRSGSVTHLIVAHEIGHNLNADHVANSGSCANSIMNPSLTSSATSFCDVSKSQISSYVTSYGSCLSAGGTGPSPTPTPTPTPTVTYSISGNVNYYQAQKPVPNVLLSVSGTTSTYAYTNSIGSYVISNLTAGGYYTVTPYKNGGVNGITSFDATLIARHVAAGGQGTNALTANQGTAADTDGDGTVTSFDAALILRYVAANGSNANTGQAGSWKFAPSQRSYLPLLSSQTNQNYQAFLVGDVDGDWIPN
ncbi:MAG: M12 family metallo-peptidase [Acidobacteriota bacterium]|nr:M12 family metallo-peptidase [Acidobacteriota bacterium]